MCWNTKGTKSAKEIFGVPFFVLLRSLVFRAHGLPDLLTARIPSALTVCPIQEDPLVDGRAEAGSLG